MLSVWVLAQQPAEAAAAGQSIDYGVYGVAGVTVAILFGLLKRALDARDRAEQRLLKVVEKTSQTGAEVVAALDRSTRATTDLTAEVRRLGERQ